jgi:putative flippase GtrA
VTGPTGPARDQRRRAVYEFGKFAVVGIVGVVITNGVYDLLYWHRLLGPVTSTTVATVVATVVSYLANRYWSFRARQRTGVPREVAVFAALNGAALLIQDAVVGGNYYLLHLGHNRAAEFTALNLGIVLATLFRFSSYRRFVWRASSGEQSGEVIPTEE